jgi:hypothetical protein
MAGAAAEDLVELVAAHLQLARAQLVAGLGKAAPRLARLAGFAAMVALGYALVVLAGVLALARTMGLIRSFLLVGGFHVTVGALGMVLSAHRLGRIRLLEGTGRGISAALEPAGEAGAGPPRQLATTSA